MNIDIKKLTGEWLEWATNADEHKKGSKDEKINSAFEEEYIINAAIDAGKSTEEVTQIFGAEFGKKYELSLSLNTQEVNNKSDKAENMQNDILKRYLTNTRSLYIDNNMSWKNYVQVLKEKILSPDNTLENRGYYTTLIKQMETVADAMDKEKYNSRDDIKNLYKKVKEELNTDNDKFKKFKIKILQQMIITAEEHQKAKETNLIQEEYKKLRKTKSREEAVESIQNDKRFEGSYFHDYMGKDMERKFKGKVFSKLYKGLIHKMEDGIVLDEARKEVFDAIDAQRKKNGGLENSKEIEDAAKESMGKSLDKYAEKVFDGDLTFAQKLAFERSNVKAHRKAVASDNRANTIKQQDFSADEIKDVLKNDLIFNGLLASGKITLRETTKTIEKGKNKGEVVATYDISNLSDMIRDRVGTNLKASPNSKNMYAYSEVENIVKDIARESGITNVTTKDAKNLIKLCGFEVEGKNWVRIFINAAVGSVITGASTYTGAVTMAKQAYDVTHPVIANIKNNVHAKIDINITGGDGKINKLDLMKSLKDSGFNAENIELIQNGSSYTLIIDRTDLISKEGDPIHFFKEFSNRAGEVALRSMLISFALNLMKEAFADYKDKTPITPTQFKHTSITDYMAEIDLDKKLTPAQKESLKALAEAYIQRDKNGEAVMKDGEPVWDVEEYKKCLDRMAGNSSFLESDELYIGIQKEIKLQNEFVAKKIIEMANNDKKSNKVKSETKTEPPVVDAIKQPDKEIAIQTNYDYGNKHTWKGIASHYSDCLKNGYKLIDIIHRLKDINNIPYNHPLIPEKLYLPEYLFEGKEFSRKRQLSEAEIKKNDMVLTPEDFNDNRTAPITVTLDPIRVDGGWKGRKMWPDGTVKLTEENYKSEAEAKNAANKLEKD